MSARSSELLANLEANLPPMEPKVPEDPTVVGGKEIQDDYEFSRTTYRELVDQSNQAIKSMMELAVNSEHPRAFEVLSTMLKNTSEITDKLMDLQKKKKEINSTKNGSPLLPSGSTFVFNGSTAELQKQLLKQVLEKNEADAAGFVE